MQLRLDSHTYRLLWHIKKFLHFKDAGPLPIKWVEPCRNFKPPPNFQQSLDMKDVGNFDALVKELEILTQVSVYLPQKLTEKDWHKLCQLKTPKERFEHLIFLNKREKRRAMEKQKDEIRKEFNEKRRTNLTSQRAEMEDNDKQQKFLLKTGRAEIERMQQQLFGQRCVHAFQLIEEYPRLVVDCRWLALHSSRGMNLAAKQLNYLLAANRERERPWPVVFANFSEEDSKLEEVKKSHLQILTNTNSFVAHVTPQSYLDLYPDLRAQKKIVYLSPHSQEPLEKVEAGTCYVIGGIVDRIREPAIHSKASLLTADEEQLPCKKLPITKEMLKSGHSMLTLDQVMLILQEVFDTHQSQNCWQSAIEKHLPKRKMTLRNDKNLIVRRMYANIARRNKDILRILEEEMAQTKSNEMNKNGQRRIFERFPKIASYAQFLHQIPSIQHNQQRRHYSTSPTKPSADEQSIPQRQNDQQIQEATDAPDWTIRRQPTRPKSALSRQRREQQFMEQFYTHLLPLIGLKLTEKDRRRFQIMWGIWILLDLFILGMIWRLEMQENIDPEEKHQRLSTWLALFCLQNIFFVMIQRYRLGVKLDKQLKKNGK